MNKYNIGILASMSWNSNKWKDDATDEDLDHSKYEYVKENGWMHESINFGYDVFPLELDGTFIAYTPMFNRLPSIEASKYVNIVFLRSLNYHKNKNYIVGFYAFPKIDKVFREAKHKYYKYYDYGNIKSKPEHIVVFKKPIEISNEICEKESYLPLGKKLGLQGFNYLTYNNVFNILNKASALNPIDKKLKEIKINLFPNT